MKSFLKSATKVSVLSLLAIVPILLSGGRASAQTKGTDANYVGAGVSAGVTNGGQTGDAATFGGNIQGRFAVPNAPVSVRGAVEFTDKTSTIMPMLTYDMPIANNTNLYVGGGYAFHEKEESPTPFGNKNAPVVTAGVERQFGQSLVVFSDAKVGIQPYENSSASSVSLQLGAGYRF